MRMAVTMRRKPMTATADRSALTGWLRRTRLGLAVICLAVLGVLSVPPGPAHAGQNAAAAVPLRDKAAKAAANIREETGSPAVAVILVRSEGVPAIAVTGVRQKGRAEAATTTDAWHIGSNSKAVTAALALRLVEKGALTLDTTVADAFKDRVDTIDPAWGAVTLEQLLSHRSGAAVNARRGDFRRMGGRVAERDPRADRLAVVSTALAKAPPNPPGAGFDYSNLGYVIAGAMMEAVTDTPYAELVTENVFTPLGMDGVVFGPPLGEEGAVIVGHRSLPLLGMQPVPADFDNPPFMGPAGAISYTPAAYAAFLQDQLRGARAGDGTLLPAESYDVLHTPPDDLEGYALGWSVAENGWLVHNGSNTAWFARAVIAPDQDLAVAILTNGGQIDALRGPLSEATSTLIGN